MAETGHVSHPATDPHRTRCPASTYRPAGAGGGYVAERWPLAVRHGPDRLASCRGRPDLRAPTTDAAPVPAPSPGGDRLPPSDHFRVPARRPCRHPGPYSVPSCRAALTDGAGPAAVPGSGPAASSKIALNPGCSGLPPRPRPRQQKQCDLRGCPGRAAPAGHVGGTPRPDALAGHPAGHPGETPRRWSCAWGSSTASSGTCHRRGDGPAHERLTGCHESPPWPVVGA